MMTTKISLITWNSKCQAPGDDLINDIVQALADDGTPDIVVIAMQEAPAGIGEQLDEKLMQHIQMKATYLRAVDSAWIGRIIKRKTLTRLCVIKKNAPTPKDKLVETTFTMGRVGVRGKAIKGTEGDVFGWNTKGGIYAIVDNISDDSGPGAKSKAGSRRVAFIGAHLDSHDEQSRALQIDGLLTNAIYQDFRQQQFPIKANVGSLPRDTINERLRLDFDAVFLMGDLNYRLRSDQDISIPVSISPGQVGTSMSANISADEMANLIVNCEYRTSMLTQLDSLRASPLKTDFHFEFNSCLDAAGQAFLPTYKLSYGTNGVNNLPGKIVENGESSTNACKGLYALSSVFNHKRKQYDLGWLDRIGWVERILNQPGGDNRVVTLVSQRVFYRPISDHFPVMVTVELR